MRIGDSVPPYDVCMSLLKYIYYGNIYTSPEDALYLLSASHYFQFTNSRLQVYCKQNLEANVTKDNVFDVSCFFFKFFFPMCMGGGAFWENKH
jgi:hypothetical protein